MSVRNEVAVVGAGVIPFGELYEKSYEQMVSEAYQNCMESVDNGMDPEEIEAMWFGVAGPTPRTGSALSQIIGLTEIPSTRVENACATGSDAFRNACNAVAAGLYDVALVVAAEKMLDRPGGLIEMAGRGPQLFWRWAITMPSAFALWATRHMHEYGTKKEHFAKIAHKNHHYGKMNPYSHYRREVSVDDVMDSPMVAWPLSLYDCCPITDGAAATLVVKEELAKEYTDSPVYVLGSGLSTQQAEVHMRSDFTSMLPTVWAGKQAYKMAGIGPEDIDFAELHDCFTSTELIAYEDLGFCGKGEGGKFIDEEGPYIGGSTPCNISGGLKSHGHPVGATGNAQIVELFWQLRNEAPKSERQVPDAEIGLQHNIGGMGPQVSCVNILSNEKV